MESSASLLKFDQQVSHAPQFTISTLENSIEFYLEYAFIIKELTTRLFIRNNNTVVIDQAFSNETEAREAFMKYFGNKGWRKDIRPSWSKFFEPDLYWIEFLLSDLKDQPVNF